MTSTNKTLQSVTERIIARSEQHRSGYLDQLQRTKQNQPRRAQLSCTNFAHAVAAASSTDKITLHQERAINLGIVSAYNDLLSAHQPFDRFPKLIRQTARDNGATAQFAGGVPAMCDGVTQGRPGMEMSLFSRDVIAQATAVALSHDVFDAAVCLGTCDKIVPGLLMGTLAFGHLPTVFIPAGPMTSGLPNSEKAIVRQKFAQGQITRKELMESECASYHGPGTCTFYGTANSNQMLLEVMGLQLPGTGFINPGEEIRDLLTCESTEVAIKISATSADCLPIGELVDVKTICNAIVGLLATGGSSNHTIHLIAIARCAGIIINWSDFSDLSSAVPALTKVYPNGTADVNQFHAAGGMALVISQLLAAGLLHDDVKTIAGEGLHNCCCDPVLNKGKLEWTPSNNKSADSNIIANVEEPFDNTGGLAVLDGNIGRAIIKISAVDPKHYDVKAPAKVFTSQAEFLQAFQDDQLNTDFVAVLVNQGPKANGMPELHKLTPALGVLQDKGFAVALVTDGRMSGASGKVPAAIHVTPECASGGKLGKIKDGDMIHLHTTAGKLNVEVDQSEWDARDAIQHNAQYTETDGRLLFSNMRATVSSAETGALSLFDPT